MPKPIEKSTNEYWAYLFLLYAAAVFLFPIVFSKAGSFFIKQDNLHQAFPTMNKLAIALHKGYLPVWDANTFGGKNFAGDLIPGIFYPLNIVWCLLFGTAKGIGTYYLDLLVAFHYLLCLFGMYKIARVLQLPYVAAIAAALVFTFTSALGARAAGQTCIFFGLCLLPWSVYFMLKYYLERPKRVYFIVAGVIAGLEILAGHMQPFFHTILIGGIIVLFFEFQAKRDWWHFSKASVINLFLVFPAAIIIALPQIYYAAQYMSRSLRTVSGGVYIGPGEKVPMFIYAHWFIIRMENLGNLLAQSFELPDDDNTLYMGVLPLLLVIVYLVWPKKGHISIFHGGVTKLLSIILAVGGISVLGYLTLFYLVLYEIPFVNLVRQLGRYIILISFSASLLTGLAITYISECKHWLTQYGRTFKTYLLFGLAMNALFWVIVQGEFIPFSISIPYLVVFLFLLSLFYIKPDSYFPIFALGVIFVDIVLNPVSYLSTRTPFYPDYFYRRNKIIDSLETSYGKYRVMFDMEDYSLEWRNLGEIYSIQTKWGYSATVNLDYAHFTNLNKTADPTVDDLLNIRYILTDRLLDSGFIFKDSVHQVKLYERKNWYPRYYWKQQIGKKGRVIEAENKGVIHELAYTDSYQKIAVDCRTPDTLIFSENYYPGWKCYDNGKEISIYQAKIGNYPPLFRSIVLGPGRHIIEFKYRKALYFF